MPKPKIDWKKVWMRFDWWNGVKHNYSMFLPPQKREIQSLIKEQLKRKSGRSKPVFSKKD
jgi:hypothetical protein